MPWIWILLISTFFVVLLYSTESKFGMKIVVTLDIYVICFKVNLLLVSLELLHGMRAPIPLFSVQHSMFFVTFFFSDRTQGP